LVDQVGNNPLNIVPVLAAQFFPLATQVMVGVREACRGSDLIVHSFLMTLAGHAIARERGIPDVSAQLFPVFAPTRTFPSLMFPALPLGGGYNRLTHALSHQLFWQSSRAAYHVLRRQPVLPARIDWPFRSSDRQPTPILYGFSPHVVPPPPDWSPRAVVSGYWFLDTGANWQPPAELAEFLAAGPPPVCIGFGSTVTREGAKLARVALEALKRAGRRGLFLTGWGSSGGIDLPEYACAIEAAPHDWLFPRMAAVVHHGGAGTTAAALRAGVPTVVTPFTTDQPFWASRVHTLGVGPQPIYGKRLTAENLAAAIEAATSDEALRRRAAVLGARIRAEDGVARAVEALELWAGSF
jgi:sterol 3beta-glucosyltransferase